MTKQKQKKNFGWVLWDSVNEEFVKEDCCGTSKIYLAKVFNSRKDARTTNYRLQGDIVRKVSLTKTGKPKAVIGRE